MRVEETALNPAGAIGAITATSAPTGTVPAVVPSNVTCPTISGTPQAGQMLAVDPGTWTGAPPLAYAYQWQQCDPSGANCASIANATGQSYDVAAADVGQTLRAVVTVTGPTTAVPISTGATAVVLAGVTMPLTGHTTWPDGTPADGDAALYLEPQFPKNAPDGTQLTQTLLASTPLDSTGAWTLTPPVTAAVTNAAAAQDGVVNLEIVNRGTGYLATRAMSLRLVGNSLVPINQPDAAGSVDQLNTVLQTGSANDVCPDCSIDTGLGVEMTVPDGPNSAGPPADCIVRKVGQSTSWAPVEEIHAHTIPKADLLYAVQRQDSSTIGVMVQNSNHWTAGGTLYMSSGASTVGSWERTVGNHGVAEIEVEFYKLQYSGYCGGAFVDGDHIEPQYWTGNTNLRGFTDAEADSNLDGNCSSVYYAHPGTGDAGWIDGGPTWERSSDSGENWGGNASLIDPFGVFGFSAETDYSNNVTLTLHVNPRKYYWLCGRDSPPRYAPIIYNGF